MPIQEKGELPDQKTPQSFFVHGPQQVKNIEEGYVYNVDLIKRLTRFLCLGTERGTACTREEELRKENVTSLEKLIAAGRGEEAVETIREISTKRRCTKQKFPVFALAICARSNDENTKKAAYRVLPDVCRIPTDLFSFIIYCHEENGGGGWGRSHRHGISGWYQSFQRNPMRLARLVTKYRKRMNWSHRDVICMAHPKTTSCELGFILRYVAKGLSQAEDYYKENMGMPDMQRICSFLQGYKAAMTTTDVTEVCRIIRQHRLDWQHVHNRMLAHQEVWEALLDHMPLEALVRNLGRITSLGLFTEHERPKSIVIQRLKNITTLDAGDLEDEAEENGRERTYVIHPFKVLLAYEAYRGGNGESGWSKWIPNKPILDALNEAFHESFQGMRPTGKKYCLAIDVGRTMGHTVMGVSNINCYTAAALMVLTITKVEARFDVFIFSDEYNRLDISANDDINSITKKMQNVHYSAGIDCSLPMMKAIDQKIRDYDVFCIYTCSDTYCGKVHADEALRQYRDYSENPNVKLVVCAMNSKGFSIADQEDAGMLDVVGFDAATPDLIANFCQQ